MYPVSGNLCTAFLTRKLPDSPDGRSSASQQENLHVSNMTFSRQRRATAVHIFRVAKPSRLMLKIYKLRLAPFECLGHLWDHGISAWGKLNDITGKITFSFQACFSIRCLFLYRTYSDRDAFR
jgi:hypothetical protein